MARAGTRLHGRACGEERGRPKFGQSSCFASDPSLAGFTWFVIDPTAECFNSASTTSTEATSGVAARERPPDLTSPGERANRPFERPHEVSGDPPAVEVALLGRHTLVT